ncbi:MAPEG family protein [Pseudoalteromonas denitrificans]|uniref:MAPEG family protein n=1 Tax=Pseudoalteromonas denitrificans DSM 6059 TaxID=1123010 RepID=A0A1I1G536_9GAMM|nr:MAPEG family protein [Pseudoalteromonas denitrificans]SFC06939.1 hypothetical protein SAMN02745724_00826 [Pseudoalteromonas denitrificans DSM 6059]
MLYAMFMMVLLTFIVGLFTVSVRFSNVKKGNVKARFFTLMQGQEVPEIVTKTTRNFNNQFEIPVLFYVITSLYLMFDLGNDTTALIFAWLFVILRYCHAYIHITYNHVLHRMLIFFAAFFCVLAMWVNLLILKS